MKEEILHGGGGGLIRRCRRLGFYEDPNTS